MIGVADESRIHFAKAVVVLNEGYSANEELTQEIISNCKNKLPEYMVPEIVEYRLDLPRTARGKVDFRALEKEAEKEQGA